QSSRNFDRNPENFLWTENRYEANRRKYNFSDGFDANIGRFNGGYFGRKEKNGWRSQGRSYTEGMNHRGGFYGRGSRARASAFHCGRGQGLRENNVPDNETVRREDKEVCRHFKAEDFPSLNPQYEREPNQNKSLAAGVWEYPLNPKSRSQRMLVMKKGSTKELQISGFPVVGGLHSQPVRNRTGTSFYKGLVPTPVAPPTKPTQWKSQAKEIKFGNQFPLQSAHDVGSFCPFKSTAKAFPVSQSSMKEFSWSKSSSPVDKVGQPRLTKLTRMRTDKSEFLKALKQDRVEEEHKDDNHAGQEKGNESFNLSNSNNPHHERDINQNVENEIPQENGNASVASQQHIQSSAFPRADVLSSSLEAEHRLLKEMGWQEDNENDESYAPLTEDEMREFRAIRERLQKNGLRRNGILKNGLIYGIKFSPWKNCTFKPALDNEDSETSSSDTSDDDDV
ncbi:GPBP1 protein, partial [Trogon melanurus]|nr:GPBP1 protein [Trogon melanurus]